MKRMKKFFDTQKANGGHRRILAGILCLFLLVAAGAVAAGLQAKASGGSLTVAEINYENSTITLASSAGDTVAYISNSSAKTWEAAPGTFENGRITFDISWISVSKNYTLSFKGDKSTTVAKIIIPKQATTFRVKYKANADNPFTFTNTSGRDIQWRKNGSSSWNTITAASNYDVKTDDFSYLKENGAKLYFRLAPKAGNNSDAGYRAGKEVAVSIPAKKAAPAVTVNASAFTVPLKSGMAYRTVAVEADGTLVTDGVAWTNVNSSKDYSLIQLAPEAFYSGTSYSDTIKKAIQFKTNATNSAQESRVTTVILPAQKKVTAEDAGVELTFTSSTTLDLVINGASATEVYEYCVIPADEYDADSFAYEDTTWTAVKSSSAVALTNKTAKEGSHIYFRKKSKGTQGEDDFALATKEFDLFSEGVKYPNATGIEGLITIIGPAGVISAENSKTFTLRSSTKTTVSSINFSKVAGGGSIGAVECTSSVAKDSDSGYIITTKITSTAELDEKEDAWGKELYATIKMANGEEIKTEKGNDKGLILYLYPPSKVDNSKAVENNTIHDIDNYKTHFERDYLSEVTEDDEYFRFIVELGTVNKMSDTKLGEAENTKLAISSIVYDAYELSLKDFSGTDVSVGIDKAETNFYATSSNNRADAMIYYEDYTNKDNQTARRAYITIHAGNFEKVMENGSLVKNEKLTKVGTKQPFKIKINNGEVLDDEVYMTLVETAKLNNAPIGWTITEGSLQETTTTTQKDENGQIISSETKEKNDYALVLTKAKPAYTVSVSDVTWGNESILSTASVAGSTIEITLSNKKINALTTETGKSTTTKDVVIHLSNGFSISSGCKLTILKKSGSSTGTK